MKIVKTLIAAVAFSVAATGAAFADDLSGVWQGAYWGGGQQPTFFQATLDDVSGPGFNGSIAEPNNFGEQGIPFLLSTLTGTVRGDNVRFVKTYDGTGGQSHQVTYEGHFESDRRIVGTWAIPGSSGQFELVR